MFDNSIDLCNSCEISQFRMLLSLCVYTEGGDSTAVGNTSAVVVVAATPIESDERGVFPNAGADRSYIGIFMNAYTGIYHWTWHSFHSKQDSTHDLPVLTMS